MAFDSSVLQVFAVPSDGVDRDTEGESVHRLKNASEVERDILTLCPDSPLVSRCTPSDGTAFAKQGCHPANSSEMSRIFLNYSNSLELVMLTIRAYGGRIFRA